MVAIPPNNVGKKKAKPQINPAYAKHFRTMLLALPPSYFLEASTEAQKAIKWLGKYADYLESESYMIKAEKQREATNKSKVKRGLKPIKKPRF